MYHSTCLRLILLKFIFVTYLRSKCFAEVASTFNINTFQVIPTPTLPLYQQLSVFDPISIVNDGNGRVGLEILKYNYRIQNQVDVYVNPNDKKNCIRGGLLGTDIYIGYQVRFNFNASIFGSSGLTFNGFGTPLLADSFWYNAKYGSALNAATFPDGIVVIRDCVRIGAPNPFFPPFEAALNQVQKVGSRTNSFLAVGFYFFYPIGVRTYYFSYKGFYASTFGEIPLKYNLATIIVTPLQYSQSISINQFKAFQRLLAGGQNFFGTSPTFFRQPKTPVLCNNGIVALSVIP